MVDVKTLEALFHQLTGVPRERRTAELDRLCGDRPDLRRELLSLLEADEDESGGGFSRALGGTATMLDGVVEGRNTMPRRIGRYRVIGRLGEGGMGVVYEAEQDNPRRRIAVKILRVGSGRDEIVRRFQREAQILGVLRHPGIAHVYEAGIGEVEFGPAPPTPGGPQAVPAPIVLLQPYLAMELVPGLPLSRHVEQAQLGLPERLALFIQVCDAVDHAHAHGIVHRDLKPANILVDEQGQPRVLDFGVARATHDDVDATAAATARGQLVGTLPYMSPEQIVGDVERLDARCDVYALGVILYELLARRVPFDVSRCSIAEASRIIRDEEPPSLVGGTTHGTGPAARGQRIDRDLQTITFKALEKDPARRYATAGALADDVRRYLRDQPIVARPASTAYQLRKFARRNKGFVWGAGMAVVVLVVAVVVSVRLALRAAHERELADSHAAESERRAYRSSLAAAAAGWQQGDLDQARRQLAAAPPNLRAWEWELLENLVDGGAVVSRESAGVNSDIVVSGDDRTAVTIAPDSNARVWDLASLGTRMQFKIVPTKWHRPRLNRDGSRLWCSNTESGGVWDTAAGRALWDSAEYRQGGGGFSPDGTTIAVTDDSGNRILLLDAATGERRHAVPCGQIEDSNPQHVTFAPDGARVAVVFSGGVTVVDLATEKVVGAYGGWCCIVDDACRRVIAYESESRQLVLRSVEGGPPLAARNWPTEVHRLYWLPDGAAVCVVDPHGHTTVLDDRLDPVCTLRDTRDAAPLIHTGGRAMSLGLLSDGRLRLAPLCLAGAPYSLPHLLGFFAESAAVSPRGDAVAVADWGHVRLYEATTGDLRWCRMLKRRFFPATSFSSDGATLAVADANGAVWIIDAADGNVRGGETALGRAAISLAWTSPGGPLVAGLIDGRLALIDAARRGAPRFLASHRSPVQCLAANPRAGLVASGSGEGVTRGNMHEVSTGTDDSTLRIWDTGTWTCRQTITFNRPLTALAFSVDCLTLAAATLDGRVAVLDPATGVRLATLEGVGECRAMAFHPAAPRLVTWGLDRVARVWEVSEWHELLAIPTPTIGPLGLGFTPDGRTLLGGGVGAALAALEADTPAGVNPRRLQISRAHQRLVRDRKLLVEDLAAQLREDASTPPDVRDAAIHLAQTAGDHVGWLISDAIVDIRRRNQDPQSLEKALARSRRAGALMPDSPDAAELEAHALYHTGDFAAARDAMRDALERYAAAGRTPPPEDFAVLALCSHRLGDARAALDHLYRAESLAAAHPPTDSDARQLIAAASATVPRPATQASADSASHRMAPD